MKIQPVLIALTLVNLVLLVFLLGQAHPALAANEVAPVLRGRALEIVDEKGKVRASLHVYPASMQKNGEKYAETVLLRLITEQGRPSVKISASEETSGLAFSGPTGTQETYTQLLARGTTSILRLKSEDGKERVVTP